jgi:sugar phosphate isomerase/epimerase
VKLGIGTYTYMWSIGFPGAQPEHPMTALALLEQARELGVRAVQYGPNLPLESRPASELDELLAAAAQYGIELELGTRGVETEHLQRMLDFTLGCGAKLLRTVGEYEGRPSGSAELIPLLRAIEPQFRRAGVRLALENTVVPAAELDSAVAAVDSEFVGITLDTVNSLAIPEGTREVASTLARWTACLHIKDFIARREWHMMGFRVEGRPAGEGQLNVPWLLDLLHAAGAKCNAILELWPPEQNTLAETIALEKQWAHQSVDYLRTLIGD